VEINLLTVYDRISALDTKVGALIARVDERLHAGQQMMDDHERRIRSLERLAWKLVGAFAAVNGLAVAAEWLLLRK
jgi:hypothetical protein